MPARIGEKSPAHSRFWLFYRLFLKDWEQTCDTRSYTRVPHLSVRCLRSIVCRFAPEGARCLWRGGPFFTPKLRRSISNRTARCAEGKHYITPHSCRSELYGP